MLYLELQFDDCQGMSLKKKSKWQYSSYYFTDMFDLRAIVYINQAIKLMIESINFWINCLFYAYDMSLKYIDYNTQNITMLVLA